MRLARQDLSTSPLSAPKRPSAELRITGLFRRLFAMIEDKARSQNEPRLWTHASLMAQPAFAAVGFALVERQLVEMGGESLERAVMEKDLAV